MAYPVDITGKRIAREYNIAATTSASAAQLLNFPVTNTGMPGDQREIIIAANGATITFNFGDSSVATSTTATSNVFPDGNFTLLSGATYSLRLLPTQNYVSVKTASGSGTAIIQLTTPLV